MSRRMAIYIGPPLNRHVTYLATRATYPFVEFVTPESAAALLRVKGMVRHTVSKP